MRVRRPSPSMLVALLALFIALGGSSYAALALPKASVGAKQLKTNAVTSPKVKPGSLLLSDFRRSQRAQLRGAQGPAGPKGDPGAQGPKGDPGAPGVPATSLWAVVGADGKLIRGSGVSSAGPPFATGNYLVTFDRDITACAYFATATSVDAGTYGNRIAVVNDTNVRSQLQVSIGLSDDIEATSGSINSAFSLAVVC